MTTLRGFAGFVLGISLGVAAPAHADVVTDWNARTVSCAGANRAGVPGLLDVAIIQAAVHDAVQAIQGRFEAYRYQNAARLGVGSPSAAVAAASYRLLVALYGAGNACLGDRLADFGDERGQAALRHERARPEVRADIGL
jgi:hypothetical protein